MTISTTTARYSYAGNGVTTAFAYSSKFLANGDLVVVSIVDATGVETVKTLTTHYTITGAGDAGGGTVTMLTAPASGTTLVIYGDPALTQGVDLVEGDDLAVETQIEAPLDRLTLITQRIKNLITRSIRLPDGDTSGATMVLPAEVTRASKILGFDADGEVTVYDESSSVTTSDNVTYTPAGAGAVARTVQAKERESVSVTDFYANGVSGVAVDPTGVVDSSAGIQAALNLAAIANADVEVTLPQGVFNLNTTTLTIPSGVTLRGAGRGSTFINYVGTGTAIDINGITHSTLKDFRIGLGSSATIVAINIRTPAAASVRWCKFSNIEIAGASVAGQKGIQAVASGGNIVTDNWFEDIDFFTIDKPIIRTDTEGNTWRGIHVDTWGMGAGVNAIDSQSHAEFMQARIAAIPAGGTGVAYKQSGSGNIDNIVVDIGTAETALNVTGTRNTITLTRTVGETPVGTIGAANILIDVYGGNIPRVLAKSAVAVTAPADTAENVLATITIPAGLLGTNGAVRINARYTVTNNANVKTVYTRFSGAAGTIYGTAALTSMTGGTIDTNIANRNATNSQVGNSIVARDDNVFINGTTLTSAVDTTAATTIILAATKATGSDTVTLESYLVELIPG